MYAILRVILVLFHDKRDLSCIGFNSNILRTGLRERHSYKGRPAITSLSLGMCSGAPCIHTS